MRGTHKFNDQVPNNLRQCNLRNMNSADKYYIKKTFSGFSYFAECQFIGIVRGKVKGEITQNFVSNGHSVPDALMVGEEITVFAKTCCLYGMHNSTWPSYHWFKDLDSCIFT
jgi:hypothetical protein